jgi:hypothetical protein
VENGGKSGMPPQEITIHYRLQLLNIFKPYFSCGNSVFQKWPSAGRQQEYCRFHYKNDVKWAGLNPNQNMESYIELR